MRNVCIALIVAAQIAGAAAAEELREDWHRNVLNDPVFKDMQFNVSGSYSKLTDTDLQPQILMCGDRVSDSDPTIFFRPPNTLYLGGYYSYATKEFSFKRAEQEASRKGFLREKVIDNWACIRPIVEAQGRSAYERMIREEKGRMNWRMTQYERELF